MAGEKVTIGISMGDPCGIGPEIVVKALADASIRSLARFVVFGFSEQFAYLADRAEVDFRWVRDHHESIRRYPYEVVVLDYDELATPAAGEHAPTHYGGRASMAFVEDAIAAAQTNLLDALVTAPISKQAWRLAGYPFPGHTELLVKRTRAKHYAMMFVAPQLRVVLATIHEPLFEIRHGFTIGCVFNPIDLADGALRELFGIEKPRIAVCGLNPHAGEEGRFGDEEKRIIAPAILMASEAGIRVDGPFPADTIYHRALTGEYDCVVAMYHDQGLIPIKLLAFDDAVNLTLGLPIIRTSPCHGTAFDIAGKDQANPASMKAAIRLAVELAGKRQK
ncbi:MAG TPA: 4-hydroxythreonine-4-phosphate dehydrogenase PdxA [Phycisphaerae bacterium]|nr:4-hydroxythreonine-4-phosphate dehydrogenase PdxA [Phycisphaerae bacterium]